MENLIYLIKALLLYLGLAAGAYIVLVAVVYIVAKVGTIAHYSGKKQFTEQNPKPKEKNNGKGQS